MGLTSELNRKYRALISRGQYPVCYLCGQLITDQNEVSQDHTIPKSKGGQTRVENLMVAHKLCNNQKGSLTLYQWNELQYRQRCC